MYIGVKILTIEQHSTLHQICPEMSETDFVQSSSSVHFYDQSNKVQLTVLKVANACYRLGYPFISNSVYDAYLKHYSEHNPDSQFVNLVEPEFVDEGKLVKLPQKMLSTDKAYSIEEIEKFISKILRAAVEEGVDCDSVLIRVTPKLDGFASYDDGTTLYTRGDGLKGQDISRAIDRGLTASCQMPN